MAILDVKKLETDLWEAADQLRANSKLTATEYCMPVLGIRLIGQIKTEMTSQITPKQAVIFAEIGIPVFFSSLFFHLEYNEQ